MILSDLRDYLQTQRRATLKDIAAHFNMDAGAIRGMLGKWIGKGKIRQATSPGGSACGTGCCKCDPLLLEIYEWVDENGG